MAGWTAAEIPDLSGRTAVVTGANSGLGRQTALELAAHGATVVLACRDQAKGAEARRGIEGDTELAELDLADLGSVRKFAADFAESHDGLDILVNNAGVMAIPQRRTVDGFEMQLGTNHLGHFALTGLLLSSLLARPEARIVTVSSSAHRFGTMDFEDLHGQRRYRKWRAYGQSKLANLLFAYELQRRADAAHSDLRSLAAHPGYSATNLQSAGPRMAGSTLGALLTAASNKALAQDDAHGALPSLYAATATGVHGGEYFGPDGFLGMRGHPRQVSSSDAAQDPESARRLWQSSEALTAVHFDELRPAA